MLGRTNVVGQSAIPAGATRFPVKPRAGETRSHRPTAPILVDQRARRSGSERTASCNKFGLEDDLSALAILLLYGVEQ